MLTMLQWKVRINGKSVNWTVNTLKIFFYNWTFLGGQAKFIKICASKWNVSMEKMCLWKCLWNKFCLWKCLWKKARCIHHMGGIIKLTKRVVVPAYDNIYSGKCFHGLRINEPTKLQSKIFLWIDNKWTKKSGKTCALTCAKSKKQ